MSTITQFYSKSAHDTDRFLENSSKPEDLQNGKYSWISGYNTDRFLETSSTSTIKVG